MALEDGGEAAGEGVKGHFWHAEEQLARVDEANDGKAESNRCQSESVPNRCLA